MTKGLFILLFTILNLRMKEFLLISIAVLSMNLYDVLNECWVEIGNNQNRMWWDENGNYTFTETNDEQTCTIYGIGTYVYQSETGELFVDILELNQRQVVGDSLQQSGIARRYFRIAEITDSTVTVLSVAQGWKYDWKINANGTRHLHFTDEKEIDHLPLLPKTYKRL